MGEAYSVHKILIFNANNVNLFVSLLCYLNTLYIQIFKMATIATTVHSMGNKTQRLGCD